MYERDVHKWCKHWDFILIDILCMELALCLAAAIRNVSFLGSQLYRHIAIILVLLNIFVVFFAENYKGILKRGYLVEARRCLSHVLYIVFALLVYLFLINEAGNYSRIIYVLFGVFYYMLTYACRCLRKRQLQAQWKANRGNHSLVIIVNRDNADETVRNICEHNYGAFAINGIAILDADCVGHEIAGIPIVASDGSILKYLKENWVDEVFIHVSDRLPDVQKLLDGCAQMGVTVHLKLPDIILPGMNQRIEKIGDYTVVTKSVRMVMPRQIAFKRALDIAGSLVGLAATGILFLFVAPAIYIRSPGPVFFTQTRIGQNGKRFKIYKFRSMYMDAEECKKKISDRNQVEDGMMFKIDDDPRIIRGVGHFIRRTSIDEMPQFWNVLKGDMSLVGTRPPTEDEWEKYELHHRKRLAFKPGITGMWQISGRTNIRNFEEVVALDTKYISEWSPGLDLKILFKTVQVVIRQEGAV
ncbi:MAG: sugar transferase [Lachnospiraceae bacterium]|nr:sugar transferase [Lachnospiraceae bacterium]